MTQSDFASTANEVVRDTLSEAAAKVQHVTADAYETVKDTAQDQPFLSGLLVGTVIGFALGVLMKSASRPSLRDHALDSFRSYAPLRRLRNWGVPY
jgi:hypothetical protein